MQQGLEAIHARLELVVFGTAHVFVTGEGSSRTHIIFDFGDGERRTGPHIHWLDDMPLAFVLIAAADTWCTGMCSGKISRMQLRSQSLWGYGTRSPYLSHLILRRLHSVEPRDACDGEPEVGVCVSREPKRARRKNDDKYTVIRWAAK